MSALPICERLRAVVPTFGHIKLMGHTKYRVNPNGPEAADTIDALYEALEALVEAVMDDDPYNAFPIAKHAGRAALAKARGQ